VIRLKLIHNFSKFSCGESCRNLIILRAQSYCLLSGVDPFAPEFSYDRLPPISQGSSRPWLCSQVVLLSSSSQDLANKSVILAFKFGKIPWWTTSSSYYLLSSSLSSPFSSLTALSTSLEVVSSFIVAFLFFSDYFPSDDKRFSLEWILSAVSELEEWSFETSEPSFF